MAKMAKMVQIDTYTLSGSAENQKSGSKPRTIDLKTLAYIERLQSTYFGDITCRGRYMPILELPHSCVKKHRFNATASSMLAGAGCSECGTPRIAARARHIVTQTFNHRDYILGTFLERKALPLVVGVFGSNGLLTKFEYPVPQLTSGRVPAFYAPAKNLLIDVFQLEEFTETHDFVRSNYEAAHARSYEYGAAYVGDKVAVLLTTYEWLVGRTPDNDLAWATSKVRPVSWWGENKVLPLYEAGYTKEDWFKMSERTRNSILEAPARKLASTIEKQNNAFGGWGYAGGGR